jgi:hypothetical protein
LLQRTKRKPFHHNTYAISEEFTILPALSLVIIGIVLFSVLTLSTYESYGAQTKQLSQIDIASYLLSKLIDTDQLYMREGQIIEISILEQPESLVFFNDLKHDLYPSGIDFSVMVSWGNTSMWVLDQPMEVDTIAVSQPIGIALNPVDIILGSITVVVWNYDTQQV